MSNSVDPDEPAYYEHLIWIYAVCKSLFLSPVAVKELRDNITRGNKHTFREAVVKIGFDSLLNGVFS